MVLNLVPLDLSVCVKELAGFFAFACLVCLCCART